jgi:hypothetical protein
MGALLDQAKYKRLLVRVVPTAIETEAENDRALGILETLLAKGEAKLSPEEDALAELLTQLIEAFEKRTYVRKKSRQQRAGQAAGRVLSCLAGPLHLSVIKSPFIAAFL